MTETPEPGRDTGPDPAADAVEQLMAECLERPEAEHSAALAAACERAPEHASELRRRWARLQAMGLAPFAADPVVPERIGDFALRERLGGGGMGVVYRARQLALGRDVALKLIRPDLLWFTDSRARFRREAEAVARLRHPGIVPIHLVGEERGVPYLALELVDGRTLVAILQELHGATAERLDGAALGQPGREWVAACCEVVRQLAQALQHCHDRGIVHRDVKPSNVLLNQDGRALLTDFGLAQQDGGARLTRSGAQPGSLAYMSPEQVRGDAVDARTDVYSLGATLFELLALRAPYTADSDSELRQRIVGAELPSLRELNRKVPADVETIVRVALSPELARRYASAGALASDLEAWLSRRPIAARRASWALRARRWAQRRPAVAVAVGLGAAIALILPSALLWQEHGARAAIEREAETVRRMSGFLLELFDESDPGLARGERLTARVVLDRGVRRIRDELTTEPEVKARMLARMGEVYLSLGLAAEGEPLLHEAIDLQTRVLGRGDARDTWAARLDLAEALRWRGDLAGAEALGRASLAAPAVQAHGPLLARAVGGLAITLKQKGDDVEARSRFEEAIALSRRCHPPQSVPVARALARFGGFLYDREGAAAALPMFTAATEVFVQLHLEGHPVHIDLLASLAAALNDLDQDEAALPHLERAVQLAEATFDPHHPLLVYTRCQLAAYELQHGGRERARGLLALARASCDTAYPRAHPARARLLSIEGLLAMRDGDFARALELGREALALYLGLYPRGHPDTANLCRNQARNALYYGDLVEAQAQARAGLRLLDELRLARTGLRAETEGLLALALACTGGARAEALERAARAEDLARRDRLATVLPLVLVLRGRVLLLAGDARAAEPAVHEALRLLADLPGRVLELGQARFLAGWAANELGRLDEAVRWQEQAVTAMSSEVGAEHPVLAYPLNDLGVAFARQGRLDEAARMLEQAVQIQRGKVDRTSDGFLRCQVNLAAVQLRRQDPEQALQGAFAVLDALAEGPRSGSLLANPAVQVALEATHRTGAPAATRSRLRAVADVVLRGDDPLRQKLPKE